MNLTQCIKAGSEDKRTGWLIKFEYNLEFIQWLKQMVPHADREWRPDTYEWWVSENHNDILKELFSNFESLAFLQRRLL